MENTNKKKFKLTRKKWLFAIVATATITTGGIKLHQVRTNNDKINSNKEYSIGYDDVNPLTNWLTNKVGENNFVLLDIKDYDSISTIFQTTKINYCENNNIDVGLIISSDSTNLGEVYLELEYLFSIMENYNINYPIYINVDTFFENEQLTKEEAINYINAFLEKASLNNIYIGVTGQTKYLENNFLDYDQLPTDNESNKLGSITLKDDIYFANKELKQTINENNLNNPKYFNEDGYHICKNGETLTDIAHQYGISVEDIKKFNNIRKIKPEMVLRIPSQVQLKNPSISNPKKYCLKGIDVSAWQGTIDWEKVDADFAIIRVHNFCTEEDDKMFKENVNGCIKNNIPMGFYSYSAITSKEQTKEEARYIIEKLQGLDVKYPVYLDLETFFWTFQKRNGQYTLGKYNEEETKEFVLDVIKTWEKEIEKAGYTPGIYCNNTLYQDLVKVSDGYINNLATWVAGGSYYDQKINLSDKENLPLVEATTNIDMKQISSKGKIEGIEGEVDINYCYVDYLKKPYDWKRLKSIHDFRNEIIFCLTLSGGALITAVAISTTKNKNLKRTLQKD